MGKLSEKEVQVDDEWWMGELHQVKHKKEESRNLEAGYDQERKKKEVIFLLLSTYNEYKSWTLG